jgi:tetratricopeptide (TPR) repeat protein
MKSLFRKSILFTTIVLLAIMGSMAQRVIKGTVYREGKPAAGITVEAQRGGNMLTSFDGKFQVAADAKTKWLKFTYIDQTKRLDLDEKSGDEIDFYFDDIKPTVVDESKSGISNKTHEELLGEKNMDYINEYSLYIEFNKQKDYKSAYPHWEKIYQKYPRSHKNIYINGVEMEDSFFNSSSKWDEKEKHIQKIMEIYDNRIKYFDQKGFVLGRKGVAWLDYYKQENDMPVEKNKEVVKKGYEWLNESAKLQGVETETPVLVLLMQTSKALLKMGELSKETVIKNFDFCNNLLNQMIESKDKEKVAKAKEAKPYIESIFGTSGAADCEALINIYTPQFQAKSNDIDFIKDMLKLLRRAKCDDSELYSTATEKLYQVEPSAEAAFNMAHRFLKRDEVDKAKQYYKQAMEQETDKDLLATYYYEYGYFIFAKENAFQEARNYANKALAINPNYCEAIMMIGDIYVAASRTFGADDFEKSTVFWVAVDYFNKAARISEDCFADASQKVATYKVYYPNKTEAFFRGLTEGQNYTVGGWINETTKVRF